jgi:hypothetical protein
VRDLLAIALLAFALSGCSGGGHWDTLVVEVQNHGTATAHVTMKIVSPTGQELRSTGKDVGAGETFAHYAVATVDGTYRVDVQMYQDGQDGPTQYSFRTTQAADVERSRCATPQVIVHVDFEYKGRDVGGSSQPKVDCAA